MATVGDVLVTPEAGWQRFDNTNANITYVGTWFHFSVSSGYNGASSQTVTAGDSLKFNFTGTRFRIIGAHHTDKTTSADIFIDNVKVATINQNGSLLYQTLECDVSGLTNTEHYVSIVNNVSGGLWIDAFDIDATGTLKPTPSISSPTNLVATAGDNKVSLSWNTVTGATGYNVKSSTTAGGPYTTIASNVSGPSYVDTTVTNGTTYYYVVTAITADGESNNSNEASATPTATGGTPDTDGQYLLVVTLAEEVEREYALAKADVDAFVAWYAARSAGAGLGYYTFNKNFNRTDYMPFDKIITFEVTDFSK